ncbi:MAG: TIGR01906 family membrane protein [Brevibacterium yomogidense]
MTADDPNEPKDLLSRRLSSQPDGDDPTAAHYAGGDAGAVAGAHESDRSGTFDASAFDPDATASFDPIRDGDPSHDDQATAEFDPISHTDADAEGDHGRGVTVASATSMSAAGAAGGAAAGAAAVGSAGTDGSAGRPGMISDEEWSLINGESAAAPAGDQPTKKLTRKERRAAKRASKLDEDRRETRDAEASMASRTMEMPERRRNPLDVIGAVWITLGFPFVALALAVRTVASGWFLAWTYNWRPGFPDDQYGFTDADRLHYGSYTVDYLFNLATERYLSDVVLPDGTPLFTSGEISHMADVKSLIGILTLTAVIAAIGMIVFGVYKCRRGGSGVRGSLRAGPILTLVLFAALAVLAVLGWEQFFTGFHDVFFAEGTWTFYMDDSLIRLFPPQFWVDAGIALALIVLVLCVFAFCLSFAGRSKKRRARRVER